MASNTSDIGKYKQPEDVAVPSVAGYPNNVANTQTMKIRGTGAATKGTRSSSKLG